MNQVRKNLSSPQFTTNVEYEIYHISKTKNRTKKTHELKIPFQNVAHLLGLCNFFVSEKRNLNIDHSGYFPTKDMQTPRPQLCSRFNERWAMGWIELKINFLIFTYRVIISIFYSRNDMALHCLTQSEKYISESCWIILNIDYNSTFSFDLSKNKFIFSAKSIRKV